MYLGFSQIPLAIGWTLEGKLGPLLYDHLGSKDRFARELLQRRLEAGQAFVPQGDALAAWAERQLDLGTGPLLESAVADLERALIRVAMARAGGRRQEAARLLGCGRNTLARKIRDLGLDDL